MDINLRCVSVSQLCKCSTHIFGIIPVIELPLPPPPFFFLSFYFSIKNIYISIVDIAVNKMLSASLKKLKIIITCIGITLYIVICICLQKSGFVNLALLV